MRYDNVLAIVPARRGSKRFPGKNTALFQGVPLAQNTIRIAKEAGIEKIIVTTDDIEVINIALGEGAPMFEESPPATPGVKILSRESDLCTDDARTEAVVENAVNYASSSPKGPHWTFDTICLMQVTSPMLNSVNLQIALDGYFETKATSLTAINSHYKPCGAFYIVNKDLFMRNKSLYHTGGGVYMLPEQQCIDVDHPHDLFIANAVDSGREM